MRDADELRPPSVCVYLNGKLSSAWGVLSSSIESRTAAGSLSRDCHLGSVVLEDLEAITCIHSVLVFGQKGGGPEEVFFDLPRQLSSKVVVV